MQYGQYAVRCRERLPQNRGDVQDMQLPILSSEDSQDMATASEPWIGHQVPYTQSLEAKYDFLDTQTDVTSPNGSFCLEPDKIYCNSGCTRVPMNARYIAQSMGLQVYRTKEDVVKVAVFPLESGSSKLHCLVVAERELMRFVDRRFAASIESSWPRKKDKKETVFFSLTKWPQCTVHYLKHKLATIAVPG
ncbi:hypothetical protein WJX77_006495 [Trebouxia sp. C0004]